MLEPTILCDGNPPRVLYTQDPMQCPLKMPANLTHCKTIIISAYVQQMIGPHCGCTELAVEIKQASVRPLLQGMASI